MIVSKVDGFKCSCFVVGVGTDIVLCMSCDIVTDVDIGVVHGIVIVVVPVPSYC